MDDPPPPKHRLALKPREVDPVDKVARTGDGTAISVQLIHKLNQQAADRKPGDTLQPPAAGELEGDPSIFRQRTVEPLDPPSAAGDEEAISVQGMLHRNHSAAIDTGPELIAMPARRRSRRHRDFMLLLAAATLAIGVLGVVFRQDRQIVALALFGIVFTTVILAWVMYGIMDRY
jgi:hypothetical protein